MSNQGTATQSFFAAHEPCPAPHSDELMTRQEFKEECDINNIIDTYKQTGIFNHVTTLQPSFDDMPDQHDYQDAMNTLIQAEDAFLALPSVVRDYFHNDPAELLGALQDPAQADKLREFGVLRPLPQEPPTAPPAPSGTQPQAGTPASPAQSA